MAGKIKCKFEDFATDEKTKEHVPSIKALNMQRTKFMQQRKHLYKTAAKIFQKAEELDLLIIISRDGRVSRRFQTHESSGINYMLIEMRDTATKCITTCVEVWPDRQQIKSLNDTLRFCFKLKEECRYWEKPKVTWPRMNKIYQPETGKYSIIDRVNFYQENMSYMAQNELLVDALNKLRDKLDRLERLHQRRYAKR